ncbi:hypothetical protein FOCC_FOCC008294 [Frankliniella occidentalis]|nr:hypothetical protein FOCC_FOCC008294 [Frankliniella occidentalis]
MADSGFTARDIGLRAQKKILSRMASKNVARVFIDDTTSSLLDNLYRLAKSYSNNKKEAEKLVKNIIKVVIKLGVLYRNGQFSADEMKLAERFKNDMCYEGCSGLRSRLHAAAMAAVSFHEVEFSYDVHYLLSALNDSKAALQQLVASHLTDKSMTRIDHVFSFFANQQFLDAIFRRDSAHREHLSRLVHDMNKAMDEGSV